MKVLDYHVFVTLIFKNQMTIKRYVTSQAKDSEHERFLRVKNIPTNQHRTF